MGQQGKVSTNKAASKVSQLIENLFLIACCITATPPTTWDHQEPIQSLSSELTHKPFMFYYNCTVFFAFICVLSTLFLHIFLPATSSRFSLDCCSVKLNTQHAGRGHFVLSCTTVIWVTKPHWCPILVVLFLHMDYYWSLQPQWVQRLCWRAMKTWHLGHGQWWCTGIGFRDLRGSFPIFTILWLQAIGEVLQDAPWDLLQQQPFAHVQTHLPLHGAACVFPLNTPGSVSPPVSSGNQWTSEGLAHKPVKQPEPMPVLLSLLSPKALQLLPIALWLWGSWKHHELAVLLSITPVSQHLQCQTIHIPMMEWQILLGQWSSLPCTICIRLTNHN